MVINGLNNSIRGANVKEFSEIIKIFLEKHLLPTIIAVGCSILTIALVPQNYWLIIKLGNTWFGIFCFCLYFTLIQIVINISKLINRKASNQKYEQKQNIIKNQEILEQLWTLVDEMNQEDYNYLIKFIKSKNAPIEISGNLHYSNNRLLNSKYVNITTKRESEEKLEAFNYSKPKDGTIKIPIERVIFTPAINLYKLKPDFYNVLEYSYETYGRISHFDRDV